MSRYYDKQGKPLELMQWAQLFEDNAYRHIAETTLPDGTWVSTVWLGLDHNFGRGVPVIFETMVFPHKDDNSNEQEQERYSTLEEALNGHTRMVQKYTQQQSLGERKKEKHG